MRFFMICAALAMLSACAVKPSNDASPERIQAAAYRPAAPGMQLITIINNRSGAGAHSALFIEASQAVLFDPAGSFVHEKLAEKGDVLYGMSPPWIQGYKSSHARKEFHVVSQVIPVSAGQAERALQLVQARGAVADAQCALSISQILKEVPGFENIRTGYYPKKLMSQIDELPGVTTSKLYENDDGDVLDGANGLLLTN